MPQALSFLGADMLLLFAGGEALVRGAASLGYLSWLVLLAVP